MKWVKNDGVELVDVERAGNGCLGIVELAVAVEKDKKRAAAQQYVAEDKKPVDNKAVELLLLL